MAKLDESFDDELIEDLEEDEKPEEEEEEEPEKLPLPRRVSIEERQAEKALKLAKEQADKVAKAKSKVSVRPALRAEDEDELPAPKKAPLRYTPYMQQQIAGVADNETGKLVVSNELEFWAEVLNKLEEIRLNTIVG